MNSETKICQNCKTQFTIAPEDFVFYKKIDVPPPTWCPECRMVRRMTWRNERSLYQRKCTATGKDIISMFHPDLPMVVYDRDYWWSDTWDPLASGRAYDFTKSFFVQFRELLERAPLPNLFNENMTDTAYANHCHGCKACYLIFGSTDSENVLYAKGAVKCKDSLDLYLVERGELCYGDTLCADINRVHFSYDVDESMNSTFLRTCKNMRDSLGCMNLRNKSNHIFNKPYSPDAYAHELETWDLGSYENIQKLKERFRKFVMDYPMRHASTIGCEDVTGDNIMHSKGLRACFDIYGKVENAKYITHAYELRDSYDGYAVGVNTELAYEGVDLGLDVARCAFAVFTHHAQDTRYTYAGQSCTNVFGCVGLRSKKYCILNKQYTKEEYENLVPKIIAHMDAEPYIDGKGKTYRYGEFFPSEISPFAYNETVAQEHFPLAKEEIQRQGYRWREPQERKYEITKQASELPDHIKDADSTITKEIIGCAHGGNCNHQCTAAFKIIPIEFASYKKLHLPLPRLCPNCRHYERLALRNPLKLWHRQCQCAGAQSENGVYKNTISHSHTENHCPNEFETAYAPDRKEIVYCDQCYKAEVI